MPSYEFQKPLTYLDQLNCFLQHSIVGAEKGLTGVRSSGLKIFVDYSTTLSQEDYDDFQSSLSKVIKNIANHSQYNYCFIM